MPAPLDPDPPGHHRDPLAPAIRTRAPRTRVPAGAGQRHTARPALGVAMVLGSGVLFGVNGIVSKLILHAGLDAPRLTALRAAGATAGLLILSAVIRPGPARLRVRRAELPTLIWYGLTGFFLVPMLYFVAIDRLPVGIGLLFEYTAPLLVALWARFGRHQRVRSRLWAGIALALAGLACVAQVWGGGRALDPIGVAAGLGAAVLLAVYYLLGARGVAGRDTLSLTWWGFLASALASALVRPWWTFPFGVLGRGSGGVPVWALVVYLVCFGSIAAYGLVAAALRHLPPTSVGLIGMIEPVVASVVAWLILGENLTTAELAGGVMILLGVALAETARTAGPAAITDGPVPG